MAIAIVGCIRPTKYAAQRARQGGEEIAPTAVKISATESQARLQVAQSNVAKQTCSDAKNRPKMTTRRTPAAAAGTCQDPTQSRRDEG